MFQCTASTEKANQQSHDAYVVEVQFGEGNSDQPTPVDQRLLVGCVGTGVGNWLGSHPSGIDDTVQVISKHSCSVRELDMW